MFCYFPQSFKYILFESENTKLGKQNTSSTAFQNDSTFLCSVEQIKSRDYGVHSQVVLLEGWVGQLRKRTGRDNRILNNLLVRLKHYTGWVRLFYVIHSFSTKIPNRFSPVPQETPSAVCSIIHICDFI